MRIGKIVTVLICVLLIVSVAACGRKNKPVAPDSVDPQYPRTYPKPQPVPQNR